MYSLLANVAAVTAAQVDADITAIQDPQITLSNSHYLLPEDRLLMGVYGMGANITQLKIDSPALRSMYLPYVRPLDRIAAPADEPNIALFTGYELTLRKAEEVKFLTTNDAGAGETHVVLSMVGDGRTQLMSGPIFTMKVTATITTVSGAWTSGSLTLDQSLPAGRYSVVGMDCFGTGLIAARLIFPSQVSRPGVVCCQNAGQNTGQIFRRGNMGEFGQFQNTSIPSIEVLKLSAASTAVTAYLDLIYLGR